MTKLSEVSNAYTRPGTLVRIPSGDRGVVVDADRDEDGNHIASEQLAVQVENGQGVWGFEQGELSLELATANGLVRSMRQVLSDAQERLDELSKLVGQVEHVAKATPLILTTDSMAKRLLEALDGVRHVPTGGTHAMHLRTARDRVIDALLT